MSTGNFWVDSPTMQKDDMITQEGVFSDVWFKSKLNTNNYSTLLGDGVTL